MFSGITNRPTPMTARVELLIYWRVYEIIQIFLVDDFFGDDTILIIYMLGSIPIIQGESSSSNP